ncbi:MAG: sulfotransferase family 2 domain-containing protein [Bacteroidota bacterium]
MPTHRGPVHKFKRLALDLKERYAQPFAFVHINKTGGTSVVRALGIRFQHLTAMELREKLGDDRWESRYTFSFVRNPWDRVVSLYHFRVKTNQTGLGDQHLSFSDWARVCFRDRDPQYLNKPKMFAPATDWLAGPSGEIDVDFVGRFERLSDDFAVAAEAIGKSDVELPHLKSSSRGDYREYYDADAIQVVGDAFASDVEAFGYDFGR